MDMELQAIYQALGVSPAVYRYIGDAVFLQGALGGPDADDLLQGVVGGPHGGEELVPRQEVGGQSRPEVFAYGEAALERLRDRFADIDRTAEYNQAKVLHAMQQNRVNATHFAATTGYGYDDEARVSTNSP